jgi:tetratricopeptide (TPR) repeat protein
MPNHPLVSVQLRLILLITIVHGFAWFAYYGQIPLGHYLSPQETANIEFARQIATSSTEAPPATLYHLILSGIAKFTDSETTFIRIARALNLSCLVLATGFCASAAGYFWKRNRALWITGLCVGLNPVLIFWAGELAPTLVAVACLSAALWRMLHWIKHPSASDSLRIGLALSLGAACQSALLGLTLLWPLFALLYHKHKRPIHFAMALVCPGILAGLIFVSNVSLQTPLHFSPEGFTQKIYASLNNHEAFDGKSYGMYCRLHLPLLLNPIHWGLLLILAIAGSYTRFKNGYNCRSIYLLAFIFALYAASSILLDGSSRDRLAMVPLLAILSGGAAYLPHIWVHAGKSTRRTIIVGTALITGLTYSNFYDINSSVTWEQDYALLAQTNLKLGNNKKASTWADKALNLNAQNEEMKNVLIEAQFNEWTQLAEPEPISIETAQAHLKTIEAIDTEAPTVNIIEGIYHWKLRDHDRALALWKTHASQDAFALICLYWTDNAPKPSGEEIEHYVNDSRYELLEAAVETNRSAIDYNEIEKQLDNIFTPAH